MFLWYWDKDTGTQRHRDTAGASALDHTPNTASPSVAYEGEAIPWYECGTLLFGHWKILGLKNLVDNPGMEPSHTSAKICSSLRILCGWETEWSREEEGTEKRPEEIPGYLEIAVCPHFSMALGFWGKNPGGRWVFEP